MSISYRWLLADDLDAMRDVLELFANAFEEESDIIGDAPDNRWLTQLLAREDFAVQVAETAGSAGETIVGAVTLYVLPAYTRPVRMAYVYDLAVAEGSQRRGIATKLLQNCRRWAAEHDITQMWVQAEDVDAHAVAFYRSLGIEPLSVSHFELLHE